MQAEQIIALVIQHRADSGLRLRWIVEDGSEFVAYPKDTAQKAAWMVSGVRQGWKLIRD